MNNPLKTMFDDVDAITGDDDYEILKAPFGYPGGKSRSVKHIIPHLPYKNNYVEPFGGSAAILLARSPSRIEVYNDRFGGVTDFYRCMRNKEFFNAMVDWLDLTVQSREEFIFCRDGWRDQEDVAQRAAMWYYMTNYSFGCLGRNFGRATSGRTTTAGAVNKKLCLFDLIHKRFQNVIVENRDALKLIPEFDSHDTVFYLDPPYVDAHGHTYKKEMSHEDHRDLLNLIFSLEGFVAVSGFSNPLYEEQNWDERHTWEVFCSISPVGGTAGNNKSEIDQTRKNQEEVLWIKY